MQVGPPPLVGVSRWFGIGLIGLGAAHRGVDCDACVDHPPSQSRRTVCGPTHVARLSIALLLVVVGVLMAVYLVAAA